MTSTAHQLFMPELSLIKVIEKDSIRQNEEFKKSKLTNRFIKLAVQADYAFESAGLGTWSFDFGTKILSICKRCKLLIGITQNQDTVLGLLAGLIPADQLPAILYAFKVALDKGTPFNIQFPVHSKSRRNSDQQWFRLTGILAAGQHGNCQLLHGTIADISATVNREISRQELMSIINHEMKSPLTSIKLYIQLCQSIKLNASYAGISKYLNNANTMVDKASNLLDYFLKGSTMLNGSLSITKTEIDIRDLLIEVVNDLRLKHPNHQLILRNSCHINIVADRERIGQVVRNLLANAIKYSPDPVIIVITYKIMDDQLQVSIKDHGIGIPPTERFKIFDKYHRVNNQLVKAIPGHGIGLYLCKHIINEHHGKMWFISEENKGSTFYFCLPIT
jgi:two-component system sensor histidine kinase VicK